MLLNTYYPRFSKCFNIYLDFFCIKHLQAVYFICIFVKHLETNENNHP
jgi:hypothetical protein